MNELSPTPAPLAHAPSNPMELMASIVQGGISAANVEVFGKLLEYHQQIEKRDAEKAFNAAFVAMQAEMPAVQKRRAVESKGVLMYCFAPFEDIMEVVAPYLKKHGFAVSFSQRCADNRIISICTLMHIGGHSRTNEFSVKAGTGPPNSSAAQGDGSNSTYAKRFALCNALNIVIEGLDDDARNEGAMVTNEEADELIARVGNLLWPQPKIDKFLKWAGGDTCKTFYQITSVNLDKAKKFIAEQEALNVKPSEVRY